MRAGARARGETRSQVVTLTRTFLRACASTPGLGRNPCESRGSVPARKHAKLPSRPRVDTEAEQEPL